MSEKKPIKINKFNFKIDTEEPDLGYKQIGGFDFFKTSVGIVVKRMEVTKSRVEILAHKEYLSFDSLKHIELNFYDVFKNKTTTKKYFEVMVNNKRFIISKSSDIKIAVKEAKRGYVKITTELEEAVMSYLEKLPVTVERGTNCYTFIEGKLYSSRTHQLFDEIFKHDDLEGLKKENVRAYISDTSEELTNLELDVNIVNSCKNIIKRIPREDKELENIKLILSWSIGAFLKLELKRLGINLFPNMSLLGPKGCGKSTQARLFVMHMWNGEEYVQSDLSGVEGARFANKENNTFPRLFDEILSLKSYALTIKNSTTKGYIKIPKGTQSQGMRHVLKSFSMIITSNSFLIGDEAEKSRWNIIVYDSKGKFKISQKELLYLQSNIKHLGKEILSILPEINFEDLIIDLQEKYSDFDGRERDKIITIKVGEHICNKLHLFDNKEISTNSILNQHADRLKDQTEDILTITKNILQSHHHSVYNKHTGEHIKTYLKDFLEDPELITHEVINEYKKAGIHFSYSGTKVIISSQFLVKLNKEIKYSFGYNLRLKSTKEVQEKINKNDLDKIQTIISAITIDKNDLDAHLKGEFKKKTTSVRGIIVGVSDIERLELIKKEKQFLDLIE